MGDRDLIYENTAASKKVMTRIVIENPILSNLLFQMIIFYNFFYAFLHFLLLIFISIYKLWIFKTADFKEYIAIVLIILYPLLEVSSLFFAYRGNINETFPELIAFMTFTLFFRVPMQLGIFNQTFLFPMEKSCFWIIGIFIIVEFILGIITIHKIITTQTALFYLRNAPLVDRKFNLAFKARDAPIKSSREMAIGVKKIRENTAFDNKWLQEPEYMKYRNRSEERSSTYD